MLARDNPFRAERVESIGYRFVDGGSWDSLMARGDELGWRAALVGPDGSGKTTLIDELAERLVARGRRVRRIFLNDDGLVHWTSALAEGGRSGGCRSRAALCGSSLCPLTAFADLAPDEIMLFDGADLLGRLAWWRVRRRALRAAGLVITSHRPGLLPTLLECRTTPDLFETVIAELLDRVQGNPPQRGKTTSRFSDERKLFDRHRGNLRNGLAELYDEWAGRKGDTPHP
jgi:GTPase SAR1 family protein